MCYKLDKGFRQEVGNRVLGSQEELVLTSLACVCMRMLSTVQIIHMLFTSGKRAACKVEILLDFMENNVCNLYTEGGIGILLSTLTLESSYTLPHSHFTNHRRY